MVAEWYWRFGVEGRCPSLKLRTRVEIMGRNERTFSLAAATVVCLWACATSAQTGGGRPIRTVLALGRVASMVEKPVELTLSRVSIPADASANYLGNQSAIYVVSGALVVTSG